MNAPRNFVSEFHHAVDELDARYRRDSETMLLLGRLAARLVAEARADNWTDLKLRLTPQSRDELIASLEVQSSALAAEHKPKAAFVARLLAMSTVAGALPDPALKTRDHQLNTFIDTASSVFLSAQAASATRH